MLRPAGRAQPGALGGAAGLGHPADRRAARAGGRLRGRRLRARHREARRRPDHDRSGRGEHARRGRRGVGGALAGAGDRHRHPVDAAAPRRLPRRAARDDRPGGDVRAGREGAPTARSRPATWPRRPRRRCATHSPRPTRPVYLEIATDLLGAEVPAGDEERPAVARRTPPAAARPALGAATRPTARSPTPPRGSPSAERPLLWAGTGARDAGAEVARLAERLAAPVMTTYGAAGLLPPAHPCLVGLPAHVEPAGSLWDAADLVLAIGSDLDGVQTQNFAMPQPPAAVAVNLDRRGRRPRTTASTTCWRATPRGWPPRSPTACPTTAASRRSPSRLHERPRRRLSRCSTGARCGSSTPCTSRCPRTRSLVADMCIPGYWLGGFHTPAAPRRLQIPLGWGTLGYAFPAALGAALAGLRPGRRGGGRRRLPVRVRRAGHGGAGADPAHRRDRRRRRLRDAALRPGRARQRALRRRPAHARLRGDGDRLRDPRGDRRRARRRVRRGARRATSPSPSRACSWPARPTRSCRRRTRRRTGTGASASGGRPMRRRPGRTTRGGSPAA